VQKERNDVLIVIDMLKGFHKMGKMANPRMAIIIPRIQELLERKSRKEGCLTIFLQDSHERNDPEFEIFPEHCIRGTRETKIIDELQEFSLLPNSCVIPKSKYSGFYGTRLGLKLQVEDPERVIVMGVCTDICVRYTVADLRNRGYSVVVPSDCVETFDAPGQDAEAENASALRHMERILSVNIVSADDI
jgi:nicotinamidase-related amidase